MTFKEAQFCVKVTIAWYEADLSIKALNEESLDNWRQSNPKEIGLVTAIMKSCARRRNTKDQFGILE